MLKKILEKAYKKENMQWRVYSFDPEKDNELVYTSKAFDCIADAQVDKVEQLKKHPNYIVEISTTVVEESAQKNEAMPPKGQRKRIDFEDDIVRVYDGNKEIYAGLEDYEPMKDENWKWDDTNKYYKFDKYIKVCCESAQKNEGKILDDISTKEAADYIKTLKFAMPLSHPMSINILGTKLKEHFGLSEKPHSIAIKALLDNMPKEYLEAANIDVKNPGILEVPAGKNVEDLPQSHFEKLVDKKGYAEVIRALTNLEVWNKDKNKKLSSWASGMADKLKKKFRPESVEKFTYKYKVGDRVLYEGDKATIKELKTSGTGSLEKPYYSVEKDKEKGKMTHPAREFELKPLQESAQKNEDYKKPKSYDELKAGEWYKFNGEIRQIADRQPIDNEIQMFKVFSDLHVGNGTHAAYKSLFKPTDFVYVDKRELINKAIKERESQIAKLKLEIDALKKSL